MTGMSNGGSGDGHGDFDPSRNLRGVHEDPEDVTEDDEDGTIVVPIPSRRMEYGSSLEGDVTDPAKSWKPPFGSIPTLQHAVPTTGADGQALAPGELPEGYVVMGTYVVGPRHGKGGMGWVYRGKEIGFDTMVAIKTIKPSAIHDPEKARKLRDEAQTVSRLRHEALVNYRNYYAPEQGVPAHTFVMEFIDGLPLKKYIRTKGALSSSEARNLIRRMAEGLEYAHESGVIHRDIAPDNVIIPNNDISQAKIIDFGIAQGVEAEGNQDEFVGKVAWASPEQMNQFPWGDGKASDVYSLGLLLYFVAVGEPLPMGTSKDNDNMNEAIERRSRVPDVSAAPYELRQLLQKMLQPDPADRLTSMTTVLDELDVLEGKGGRGGPILIRNGDGDDQGPEPISAMTVAAIVGGVAILAVAVFLVFSASGAPTSRWAEGSTEAVLEAAVKDLDCTFAIARDRGALAGRVEVFGRAPVPIEAIQRAWAEADLPLRAVVATPISSTQCAALPLAQAHQGNAVSLSLEAARDGTLRRSSDGSLRISGRFETADLDAERELLLVLENGLMKRVLRDPAPGSSNFSYRLARNEPGIGSNLDPGMRVMFIALGTPEELSFRFDRLADARVPAEKRAIGDLGPRLLAVLDMVKDGAAIDIAVVTIAD